MWVYDTIDNILFGNYKKHWEAHTLQEEANSHPYIRVRDMGNKYIPDDGLLFVPDDVFPNIQRYIVEKNDLTRNMGEFIRTSTKIEPKHVEEQLFFVSKHPYNVISSKVVEAYKNGEIVLLYSTVKMPFSLPFLISKNNNGPMAIVFISSYSRYVEATDTLDISAVNLYSLLEGAYINLKLTSSNRMEQNLPLMKTVNDVYINMLGNIFDREFVLNLNIPLRNKVRYTLSRFFYDKIVGLKNREVSHNLSYNSLKDPDKDEIDRLKEQYEDYLESNKIQNIVGLIKFINTIDSK
jgi:hypothetical protein